MVRAIELEPDEPGAVELQATRSFESAFLGLPFEDAVTFFESKQVMDPAEFALLQDRFRAGGFTAADLTSTALQERAHRHITTALEGGLTIAEVSRAIRDDSISMGVTPASHASLDLIARTNVATAYGHGRWLATNDPVIRERRGFVQHLAINDARARPIHLALDGKVFAIGSEAAALYASPLGYNCRCSNRTLDQSDVDRLGLEVVTAPIPGLMPDPGWEGPPAPLG